MIFQGSTPTLKINFKGMLMDLSSLNYILVVLKQNDFVIERKVYLNQINLLDNSFEVSLTQDETFELKSIPHLKIQLRFVFNNSKIINTSIQELSVYELLKEDLLS